MPQNEVNGMLNKLKLNQSNIIGTTYLILGCILFLCICILVKSYLLEIKVETSVVNTPIQLMVAPTAGFIKEINIEPSTLVKKNQVLVKLEDLEIEKEKKLAEIDLEDAKLYQQYLINLLATEKERLLLYKNIGLNQVTSSTANVKMSEQELTTAKNNLQRMSVLHQKHYITEKNWDEVLAQYKAAQSKLSAAVSQQNIEQHSFNMVKNGLYYTGNKIEGSEQDIKSQISLAENKISLLTNKVKIYDTLQYKLTLTAPFDGKVIRIFNTAGNTIERGKPLLLIEPLNQPKQILAYLTQNEITHIGHDSIVKIYVPFLQQKFHGKIVSMDRTNGFVDEINAQYRWRDLDLDRSAVVVISVVSSEQQKFNKLMSAGMPVIIYFKKQIF